MHTVYLLSKQRVTAPLSSKIIAVAATLHEAKEIVDNNGTWAEWESMPSISIRPRWIRAALSATDYIWVIEQWGIIGA